MKDTDKKEKVIAIVGPTASGKTNIAVSVACKLNGEIISADSRLVYKDFNIGTAKPSPEEMSGIPHHLIDVQSPSETYTVGRYKKEAENTIKEIFNRNKVPIIAGGTGFYIKALLEGLNIPDVDPDEDFREEMRVFVEKFGWQGIYEKLKQQDPETAGKLYPQDVFRIIRALEVQKATGQKMSEVQTISDSEYEVIYCGLNTQDREFLYDRINQRVLIMLELGLLKEVENLIAKYGKTLSLLKTLGYKEICEYFDGMCTLDEAVENIQKHTRKFAKRQLTWFRANKKINWFFIDKMNSDEIVEKIVKKYYE